MREWLAFAIVAFLLWGCWGFAAKLAASQIGPRSVFIYAGAGVVIIGIATLLAVAFTGGLRLEFKLKGAVLGVLTGMLGTSGALFFFLALGRGKASVVVTMTALYPLVTILLSIFILKEQPTFLHMAGMLLALVAMVLLST